MAEISAGISSANAIVTVTVSEVVGQRIRIHSVSGGFIPEGSAHMALILGGTVFARWPVTTMEHIPFPVEIHGLEGDGAGAGDVSLTLNAGGVDIVGYVAITYTLMR